MPQGEARAPKSSPPASAPAAEPTGAVVRPLGKDPILLGAIILWVGFLFVLRTLDHNHTLPVLSIVASDTVALPGEQVELTARVTRTLASGAVEKAGLEVELRLVKEEPGVGRVTTDAEGIARRTITAPTEPGEHKFAVFLAGEYTHSTAIAFDPVISVFESSEPWFLCEVEAVASLEAERETDRGVLSPEAIKALHKLAQGRQIVFVSTSAAELSDRWRNALRSRAAPPAAILVQRRPSEGADEVRSRLLADLTARFGAPGAAISASATGCFAYREAGVPTIVWQAPPCDGAQRAETWEAVRATISEWIPAP